MLLTTQGKYDEAEGQYKRSLAILENVLGPDDTGVAAGLSNLASLMESQVGVDLSDGTLHVPHVLV